MKIEHIALYVNDLDKMRDFYCTYFEGKSNKGYHNQNTGFKSYFLTFENGARLEIMNRPEVKAEDKNIFRNGYVHIAFSVGDKSAVDNLTAKLRQDGYEIVSGPRTTGDGYYESCVLDPEKNLIEITE